ncbi:Ubiquitin-conjugating enzyme E2 R2 [Nowakowskiella sp. JEL0407]|nr:Ubiquitin-conjugating enzyme E2 R2 [Nowakowskiella sp. JEL0407]
MTTAAAKALQRQLADLTKNPIPGFRVGLVDDNIFEWEVGIIGPPQTIYEGGYFLSTLKFPDDFPFSPPSFKFNNEFYHPNVYTDGRVCISILHPAGDDPMSGETAEERWNPTQSVESILLSVVSLLNDPNCSSPANVDASVMFRKDRAEYNRIIAKQVELSKTNYPADLKVPTRDEDFVIKPPSKIEEDDSFWYDEEEEEDDDGEDAEEIEEDEDEEEGEEEEEMDEDD